jgi:hypothetical protein
LNGFLKNRLPQLDCRRFGGVQSYPRLIENDDRFVALDLALAFIGIFAKLIGVAANLA